MVKNVASEFTLVGKDRATLESDLSVLISPPIGASSLAICLYGGSELPYSLEHIGLSCPTSTSYGGVISDKLNCENLDNASPSDRFSAQHSSSFPIRLDTCKQVGILEEDSILIPDCGLILPVIEPVFISDPSELREKYDVDPEWKERRKELRLKQELIADTLFAAGRLKEANGVRYCGENFKVKEAVCCGDTLAYPVSCGHRLCPICMQRRSIKSAIKVEKLISKMRTPKHIVLTVENVSNIDKAYFGTLRGYFVKLRHRDIFDKCVGGFYSIETTYNADKKNWHVHIHVVADMPYVPKQELSDEWKSITEGSYIVDIKEIGGKNGQSVVEAAQEIAKYVVKPDEFLKDSSLVDEYLKAVKGLRLISTFGKYYHMELEEEEVVVPDCWCGKNQWRMLDGFYPIERIYKDVQGCYRLRKADDGCG